jgi:hypothetical protein
MLSKRYQCRKCGSFEGYRSRPRGISERMLLPLFLMRPVRCGDCFRRSYRSLFIRVMKRDELQMVDQAMTIRISALQPSMSGLYTENDSSGSSPGNAVRMEEARLQQ